MMLHDHPLFLKSKTGDWYFVLGEIPLTNYEQASFKEKMEVAFVLTSFCSFF